MRRSGDWVAGVFRPPWWEALGATLLLALAAFAWVVWLGGLSIGWDTLNHHVYLGWMAVEGGRLNQDVFAAGSMSCQYPYAYGPLYWLQAHGATGVQAALVLALPAVGAAPAVWLIAWSLFPRRGGTAGLVRFAWAALAFLSPLWWSLLDSTSNDIASSLPMIWAFALVLWRGACDLEARECYPGGAAVLQGSGPWMAAAGAMVALALAVKISQAFAALGVLVVAVATAPRWSTIGLRVLAFGAGGVAAALLVWWPWAKQTWESCGSPIYPMLADQLRPWVGHLP